MKAIKNTLIILCGGFLFTAFPVKAQQDMTVYSMQTIPQSVFSNPANVPDMKAYFGCTPIFPFPLLGSVFAEVTHSGFTWMDVFHQNPDKSLYIDLEDAIGHLAKKNFVNERLNFEILSFGFRIKRTHWVSFSLNERENFRFCYPKDLISMAWYGNSQYIGGTADFSGFGANLTHWRELAVGYSNQIDDKVTIGGRVKLLFGMSNLWIKKSELTLDVNEEYFDLTGTSRLDINMSLPEAVYSESQQAADSLSGDNLDYDEFDAVDYISNMKNLGVGLDFGINYKINDKFQIGASITDLGYIHWKTGVRNYRMADGVYTFRGIDVTDFISKDSAENVETLNKIIDSIVGQFDLVESSDPYWGPLNPNIYIHTFYNPTPKDRIYLVARGEIYQRAWHSAFTLGASHNFGKNFSVTLNYSYMNRSWLNAGAGVQLVIGPIQLWWTADNVLAGLIPHRTKVINIHAGCNWIIRYKPSYPLIDYSSF